MQTATPAFITESEKTTEGARPAVEVVIETASGLVSYGNRVTSVSDVDRVLEKYGEQGIGFAGDVTFTLENTDGIFSSGSRASGPFQGQLLKRLVSIYQFFYTKEPSIIPFMTSAKGMTTTVDMDEGTTEKLPQFVGKITRAITNTNRTVTITVRDIIQDLVEAEMGSTGLVNGNVADGLKSILEAAGFDVDQTAYELLRDQTAGTHVARAWSSGDKAIDLIQDLNKACGTNVVASAAGEMVMTQLFPLWGEFARYVYQDRSLEPLYSGEESDRDNLNVIEDSGSSDETFIVNRVIFTYKDFNQVAHTVVYQVPSSILKYGPKELPLATGASIPTGMAHVWPTRILDRYSEEDATVFDMRTSLRHASLVEVGDHVALTEPSGDEATQLVLITRASRNPFVMSAGVGVEAIREFQDEKWAFAGDASPGGSERPSDKMDHALNKSFEAADAEPGDLTPTKWSKLTGGAGTFERDNAEARTGQYSVKVVGVAASNDEWRQILQDGALLADSTQYTLSVYVKGGPPSAGSIKIRIMNNVPTELASATINGTYADWTRIPLTFTTDTNGPFRLQVLQVGFTGTYYLDDIQIDAGASAKDFQENWMHYAYAGEASDQAKPGFDLEGNNNGVINRDYFNGFEQEYVAY